MIINAAGAVVLRRPPGREPEVLAVHRSRYDDWSLPKGKLEPIETSPDAAVREIEEEASVKINLATPLDRTEHSVPPSGKDDTTVTKQVAWWLGVADSTDSAAPSHEVDQVAWLPLSVAAQQLTYPDDQHVIEQALAQPVTTPLMIVRHAKAINRKDWDGADADRPLRPRGRMQSRRLIPLLNAYGMKELITSPWLRCFATMQPYALNERISQRRLDILSEDDAAKEPEKVIDTMREIAERAVVEHLPTAVCCHRPVLPDMLLGLDLPEQKLATAECLVLHLTDTGDVHAVERHRPKA